MRERKGPTVLVVGTWIEELIDGIHCSWRLDDGRGPLIGRRRRLALAFAPPATYWPPPTCPIPPPPATAAHHSSSSATTMEAKLCAPVSRRLGQLLTHNTRKALKVVDLKEILNRASVSIPSKSNKNDLITRILASSAALDAYNAQYSPKPAEKAPEKPVVQQEQPSQADVRVSLSFVAHAMLTSRTVGFSQAAFKVSRFCAIDTLYL